MIDWEKSNPDEPPELGVIGVCQNRFRTKAACYTAFPQC